MKKNNYVWMLPIGGFLSLLMLFNVFEIPNWLTHVLSFLSVIGSGVFCSALVTFLVERKNNEQDKKQKETQQEYALASVKHKFMRLCEREYAELSRYYSEYILKSQDKWVRESFPIEDVTQKVYNLLTEIEKHERIQREERFEIVITEEFLELSDIRWRCLVSLNLDLYKSLSESLMRLLDDAPLYISFSTLDNERVENLRLLAYEIQDIVNFSSEEILDDGSVVVFKQIMFEHASEILSILNIPADSTVSCQHMQKI